MAGQDYALLRAEYNQLMYDTVIPEIAEDLGFDGLPMDKENYNFFGRAYTMLRSKSGLGSGDLEDLTKMTMQNLIHRMPKYDKGQKGYTPEQKDPKNVRMHRGPLYDYPKALAKVLTDPNKEPEDFPFNRFFVSVLRDRAQNEIDKYFGSVKRREIQEYSVSPGGTFIEGTPGGGVSQTTLEAPASQRPDFRAEEAEKRVALEQLGPELIDLLANERDKKPLLEFYRLWFLEGATIQEISDRFLELSKFDSDFYPPGEQFDDEGNELPWPPTTLRRLEDTILTLMDRYRLQKVQEKHVRPLTQDEHRAIFQSRRA